MEGFKVFFVDSLSLKCCQVCMFLTKIAEENSEGSSNYFFDIIFMKVMTNVLFDAMR